ALREYLSGNGLLNRGLFELAAAEYRKFLAEHADHEKAPVARYGLAVCLFRTEKYDDAITQLETLTDQPKFTYSAEVATMLGQSHLGKSDFKQAAEAFDRVVKEFGSHDLADDAAAGCVEALYRDGRFDESIAKAAMLDSRWPNSPLRERA